MSDRIKEKIESMLVTDQKKGIYKLRRDAFTDEEIFELEMKYIFEGNWVYLAHESQIPQNNDFFTTYIGRQPVIITRDKAGSLNAFLNVCTHRGAMLCRTKKGNKSVMTCPFHGWSFNNSGKLVKVKDEKESGYPDSFNCEGELNLKKVARFDSYRGFLFGSLNPDVQELSDYLGESTKIIDMIVNQSEDGIEVLRGASTYTFDGNWKMQAENGQMDTMFQLYTGTMLLQLQEENRVYPQIMQRVWILVLGISKKADFMPSRMDTFYYGCKCQIQKIDHWRKSDKSYPKNTVRTEPIG